MTVLMMCKMTKYIQLDAVHWFSQLHSTQELWTTKEHNILLIIENSLKKYTDFNQGKHFKS